MPGVELLSRSEELLLLAVWRLQDDAYGAAIRDYLSRETGEDWSVGAVYAPLDRLARRGLLRSWMGEPTPERGGRAKRYFKLTTAGVAALSRLRSIQEKMWSGLPALNLQPSR